MATSEHCLASLALPALLTRSVLATPPFPNPQGSHRIEALLYRDEDVAAAVPWAQQLLTDYRTLVAKLQAGAPQWNAAAFLAPSLPSCGEIAAYNLARAPTPACPTELRRLLGRPDHGWAARGGC